MHRGFVNLTVVLDWASSRVLAWRCRSAWRRTLRFLRLLQAGLGSAQVLAGFLEVRLEAHGLGELGDGTFEVGLRDQGQTEVVVRIGNVRFQADRLRKCAMASSIRPWP